LEYKHIRYNFIKTMPMLWCIQSNKGCCNPFKVDPHNHISAPDKG